MRVKLRHRDLDWHQQVLSVGHGAKRDIAPIVTMAPLLSALLRNNGLTLSSMSRSPS
jgi:hypothetical protein